MSTFDNFKSDNCTPLKSVNEMGRFSGHSETLRTDDPECVLSDKSTPRLSRKYLRCVLLSIILIAVILSIIIAASIISHRFKKAKYYGLPVSLGDIKMMSNLHIKQNIFMKNNHAFFINNDSNIMSLNLKTLELKILIHAAQLKQRLNFSNLFSISDDMSAILLEYSIKRVYRHSHLGKFQACMIPENETSQLFPVNIGPELHSSEQVPLSGAKWAPYNKSIAFTYKSQLYYTINPMTPELTEIVHVSKNLPKDNIYYGIADFLYEEDIISVSKMFWWSKTGKYLAFTAIDQTNVTKHMIRIFGETGTLEEQIKPHWYPKAGEESHTNTPLLYIYVHNTLNRSNFMFTRPALIPKNANLLFFRWIDDDRFLVGFVSRAWNESWLAIGDWETKLLKIIYNEIPRYGWVDMPNQLHKSPFIEKNENSILLVAPNYQNEYVYRGIARLNLDKQNSFDTPLQLVHTPSYDISDIVYTYGRGEMLYTATGIDPKQFHLFWIGNQTSEICLTCGNENCTYNTVQVAEDGINFIQECLGPKPITISLRRIKRKEGKLKDGEPYIVVETIFTIDDKARLKKMFSKLAFPVTKFTKLKLRMGTPKELEVEAKLVLPPDFDKNSINKYPLLIITYGGPTKQMVTTEFSLDWYHYLSSTFKFIIAILDGRGTGNRGKIFETQLYRSLADVEIEDQLDGIRAILNNFQFINKSQICAFGWSYGGFTVAHMLAHKKNDILKCGVSVAPVTDFRLYDTAYTEKFLGLFSDNRKAYHKTQVMPLAKNFKGKDFLLIHGTADDNVLFLNSALLSKELIRNGVDFDMMIYPDDDHSISLPRFRIHLWKKTITFIVDSVAQTSLRHRKNFTL